MKYFYSFLLLFMLVTACKQKVLSGKALEDKLNKTMADYLHETLKPGTEVVIKDLVYYPEKMKNLISAHLRYSCELLLPILPAP